MSIKVGYEGERYFSARDARIFLSDTLPYWELTVPTGGEFVVWASEKSVGHYVVDTENGGTVDKVEVENSLLLKTDDGLVFEALEEASSEVVASL